MKPHWITPLLPAMKCDKDCGDCCGFAPADKSELQRIDAYANTNGIEPVRQGHHCPWYQNGGCAVHPVRPSTCRLFGHVDRLACSRGHNVNVLPSMEAYIMRKIKTDAKGSPLGMTHEACYSEAEIVELIREFVYPTTPLTVAGAPVG